MSGGPVLLLLDLQEGVCRTDGPIGRQGTGAEVARRGTLDAARTVLESFRAQERPVIHVRVAFDRDYTGLTSASPRFAGMREHRMLQADDPWAAICAEVAPMDGEPVLNKGCVNPFIGTPLVQLLNQRAASQLVLAGVATNHVVESAARFATDSGYPVVVLEDACASFTEELHMFAVEKILPMYARLRSVAEYLK